jgi:signal transduction histidine kinase
MSLIQGIIRKLIFPNIDTDRFKGRLAENPTSKELRYKTLQKIFSMLVTIRDYETLTQKVVNVMVEEMDFIGGVLFLPNKDNKQLVAWSYTQSALGKKVVRWLNKPFREHVYSLNLGGNLIVQTYLTRKIHVGTRMSEFISPAVNVSLADTMQKFMDMNLCVSLPVVFLDKILGVVFFTSTRKESSQEEQEMLKTFSDQVAIAINNAQQYEKVQLQFQYLQEKTEDLESLLSLSQTSSAGAEIAKNLQDILDIVPMKLGHLKILGAVLVRYDEKANKAYAYITTESKLLQKAKSLLPKSALSDYSVSVTKSYPSENNLIAESIIEGKITKGKNLDNFVSPPLERHIAKSMQKMMGLKANVSVPINVRDSKLGALMFMFAKPFGEVGQRDIDLITAFAKQVGIILENLEFYENLNKGIEELTKTKNNLEEAISMKNDFLQIVSHQLRTPLSAVRGFVYMWRDGDFDHLASGKVKEIKNRVADNIDRLNNIVNDMIIAMESQGSMKLILASTDVEKLLKENIEMLKSIFEKKGLYIKYNRANGDIPPIQADEKYLRHVFMNLIDNAAKYTERGGLEITLRREEGKIYLRFVDTGVGIGDEDRERLFKKFSRGKNSAHINPGGSGLGLYIARQIIDEHHGKLQYSSLGEGKGTTFVVELPVQQPASIKTSSLGGRENRFAPNF